MIASMRRFSQSEVAQERLRMIKYYSRYGEKATKEAFGVGRQTIFVWSQRLQQSQGRATSLIPLFNQAPPGENHGNQSSDL